MLIKITKPGVTDGYSVLDVGATVEYPDNIADTLVAEGYAEYQTARETGTGSPTPGKEEPIDGGVPPVADETARKTLEKLKRDKLIAIAEENGIEVSKDATKAVIIAAILESGITIG